MILRCRIVAGLAVCMAFMAAAVMPPPDVIRAAEARARAALSSKVAGEGVFPLLEGGVSYGAGYAPGPNGMLDGTLSFTDGIRTVSILGFAFLRWRMRRGRTFHSRSCAAP